MVTAYELEQVRRRVERLAVELEETRRGLDALEKRVASAAGREAETRGAVAERPPVVPPPLPPVEAAHREMAKSIASAPAAAPAAATIPAPVRAADFSLGQPSGDPSLVRPAGSLAHRAWGGL